MTGTEETDAALATEPLSSLRTYVGPSSNITYLSLFFILLAFFILMNSISTFEKNKAQAVVTNVHDSFSNRNLLKNASGNVNDIQSGGDSLNFRSDKTFAFVREEIPNIRQKLNDKANTLEYRLSKKDLFVDGEVVIRADRDSFMKQIVKGVSTEKNNASFTVEVLYGQSRKGISEDDYRLGIGRMSEMAAVLMKMNLAPRKFSVGLQEGLGNDIVLRFRVADKQGKGSNDE